MKKRLTKQQRAVIIAKDVLEWLDARRLKSEAGTYCDLPVHEEEGSLQKALAKIATRSKPCTVCALGALFIGSVDKFNKLNLDFKGQEYQNRTKILDNLNSSFSQEQLILIEYAFECWPDPDTNKPGPPAIFGSKYSNDTTRLRAIMNNIINNKGTFIP